MGVRSQTGPVTVLSQVLLGELFVICIIFQFAHHRQLNRQHGQAVASQDFSVEAQVNSAVGALLQSAKLEAHYVLFQCVKGQGSFPKPRKINTIND